MKSSFSRQVQNDRWTISLGNETGGMPSISFSGRYLDSLKSAVAYAWCATHRLGQSRVPLLQTPRADIFLGAENLYTLDFSGVDSSHLHTGDGLYANAAPDSQVHKLIVLLQEIGAGRIFKS